MLSTSKSFFRNPSAGGATDPSFAYVPLLLNTTSTNGQNNQGTTTTNGFIDSSNSNLTITRNGTPTQGSITPYWPDGQWSNYFNGTTDYLAAPNSAFSLGSNDFTIEGWFYLTQYNSIGFYLNGGSGTAYAAIRFELASATSQNLYISQTGSSWANTTTFTNNIPLNSWVHIAITRSGNSIKYYFNGAFVSPTITLTGALYAGPLNWIGAFSFSVVSGFYSGYASNIRVVNGTCVYTANFTPPTTPLTAITNTALLTCQSNRFRDNSTNNFTITPNGTPRVQAFQPFSPTASYTTALYGGSGYFNGSSQLSIPNNAAFELGAGNFSYEAFVYATTRTNTFGQGIIAYGIAGNAGSSTCNLYISEDGFFRLLYASAEITLSDPASFPINQWVHCVACRSGSTLSLFVNGVRKATTTTSATVGTGGTMSIGGQFFAVASTRQLQNGYISNVRVLKGASAYDATLSTLTVPTAPVTAITNTSLLLNFTNAGIYDAATQNVITTVGDAQVSIAQAKFPPSSMLFDGTGDWLTAIDNPQLQLGTGDFTIEGWFYLSLNNTAYGIVSKGAASTGWSVNVTSGNRIQFSYTAANLTGATTTLAASTWYYFAVVRSGSATGNLKIYINGALEVTSGGAVTDNFNQTDILYVGASRTGTTPLNGYLEDIRITKAARTITASPTAAFPTR